MVYHKHYPKNSSVMNLGSQPTIDPLLPSAVEVHLINKESTYIVKFISRTC